MRHSSFLTNMQRWVVGIDRRERSSSRFLEYRVRVS